MGGGNGNAACADYLGGGTQHGTKKEDCRARHSGVDRGWKSEARKHSRFVPRPAGNELCRSGGAGGGSEAFAVNPPVRRKKRGQPAARLSSGQHDVAWDALRRTGKNTCPGKRATSVQARASRWINFQSTK